MPSAAQQIKQQVRQCHIDDIDDLPSFLAEQTIPIVIKDVCTHWPMVEQAKQSDQQALSYLKKPCERLTGAGIFSPSQRAWPLFLQCANERL